MSEREDWYDQEIAPKLMELCKACNAHGMSFLSVVEYEPGSRSRTSQFTEDAGLEMTMLLHCSNTVPNLDGYVIGLIRYCREKGIDTSASMIVRQVNGSGEQ